jgi:hypothetical protein
MSAMSFLSTAWQISATIGTDESFVLTMPTSRDSYDQSDALDLPDTSDAARRILPWPWKDR